MKSTGKPIMLWTGVVLTLVLGLMVISVQAQQGGFTEPFDDPALPDWDRTAGVEVVDGVLVIEPENFAYRPGAWGDFEMSIHLRRMAPGDFVVSFRSGEGKGYHLLIGVRALTLQQEINGIVEVLKDADIPEIPKGEWFELRIAALEGELVVFINNEDPLLTHSDTTPLSEGGIAIETFSEAVIEIEELTLLVPGAEIIEEETGDETPQSDSLTITPSAGAGDLPALPWIYTGGPSGGLGYDIRMDPRDSNVMYVTDALAGAFKSIDGGENWVPINEGITARIGPSGDGIPVFSLTVDPNNPDTIWAGTQFGGGVFRSDDGGDSWSPMSNGIIERGLTIRGFTVEPGNSDVVYLAGEISSWEWNVEPLNGIFFDLTRGAVYKSTDRGQSWSRIWYGDNLARYILIHPQNHNKLYVSTGIFDREAANSNPETYEPGGVGVLRSSDGGVTWEELGVEKGFRSDELYIGSLAMHPTDPEILFAAAGSDAHLTVLTRPVGAIYRSVDGGDLWERVLDIPNASAVEICNSDPNVIYAGAASFIYRSDDGGTSWILANGSKGDLAEYWGPEALVAGFPIDMQCDPDDPTRIFVNNYGGGNFLSIDGGMTWTDASEGYTGALMDKVIMAPDDPALVFASARSGIFRSSDGGETWEGMSRGVTRAMEAYAIAVNPGDNSHLVAIVGDAGPWPKISNDGGNTWHEAAHELTNMESYQWMMIKKMDFSPTIPERVIGIQGETNCDQTHSCSEGFGVIYSRDGGETWSISNLKEKTATELAFAPDGSVYVILFPDDIYRSVDGGENWTQVSTNITSSVVLNNPDPDAFGPVPIALEVDPEDPSRLYAGFSIGGVSISEDGGQTWTPSAAGMIPEAAIFDLVADAAHPGVIYAASRNSGVYRSMDDGATWQAINDGLLTRAALKLSLSADGSFLYLATEGGGAYRLSPDGEAPEGGVQAEIPDDSTADAEPGEEENLLDKSRGGSVVIVAGISLAILGGGLIYYLISRRNPKEN